MKSNLLTITLPFIDRGRTRKRCPFGWLSFDHAAPQPDTLITHAHKYLFTVGFQDLALGAHVGRAFSSASRKACRSSPCVWEDCDAFANAWEHKGQCPGVPGLPVPGEEPDTLGDSCRSRPSPRVPGVAVISSGTGRGKKFSLPSYSFQVFPSFLPSLGEIHAIKSAIFKV